MVKIKIISSQNHEKADGEADIAATENEINNFINQNDIKILDMQYQSNETMTVNCDTSNVGYFYSVLIKYEDNSKEHYSGFKKLF